MKKEQSEVTQILADLDRKGYKCRFVPENGNLKCIETNEILRPEELSIVCVSRYEGTKDGDDEMVIYGVTNGKGTDGVIIDSYGAYADASLAEAIVRMRMSPDQTYGRERPLKDELR